MSARKHEFMNGGGGEVDFSLERDGDRLQIEYAGESFTYHLVVMGDDHAIIADDQGHQTRIDFARHDDRLHLVSRGRAHVLKRRELGSAGGASADNAKEARLEAPMTGRVVKVCAAVGDVVEANATVLVVEAMKMEHQLEAPFAATVVAMDCAEGEQVDMSQVLARLERRETE